MLQSPFSARSVLWCVLNVKIAKGLWCVYCCALQKMFHHLQGGRRICHFVPTRNISCTTKLTSYGSCIFGPACAMYNVDAESNTNSRGSLSTITVSLSLQLKNSVTFSADTLKANLVHLPTKRGTWKLAITWDVTWKKKYKLLWLSSLMAFFKIVFEWANKEV